MKLFLAGGSVRDLLLGRQATDRDFIYDGDDAEFLRLFPKAFKVGRSFPIFWLDGREYSPLRGESIQDDLLARDLTVNALAMEIPLPGTDTPPVLYMHPQAMDDLADKVLRPASSRAMLDDPLRVFRAARFAAQLPDWTPHPELLAAMRQAGEQGLLAPLLAERVCAELRKAMAGPRPSRFFQLLAEAGCLDPWFTEYGQALSIPAGPPKYHDSTLFEHLMAVADTLTGDPLSVWMGLTHDLGKCATPAEELPRHIGHEHRGQELAAKLGQRLKLPTEYIVAGELAAALHMTAARYPELKPGTRVDLLMRLKAKKLVTRMFDLAHADRSQGPRAATAVPHGQAAEEDLALITEVILPEKWRNLGEESGERLRMLRCEALRAAG